jgi:signal transduction histidine kinase
MAENTSAIEGANEPRQIGIFPIVALPPGEFAGAVPYIVVGIGADTGGEDACVELFRSLAPDTGMAFVLIPHAVRPDTDLLAILTRCATVPVVEVLPGIRPEPDRLYVLPAGMHASLEGGIIGMEGVLAGGNSIDHFLRSLASSQKTRAVGVVLSGTHGDGAHGLRAIRGEGGIAIVQGAEAEGPAVRQDALSIEHADRIMPIDRIAGELNQIAHRFRQSTHAAFLRTNPKEPGAVHEDLRCVLRSGPHQEDERHRIARELHDNISQKLALLEMDAHRIALQMVSDPDGARSELERLRTSIGALSEEVRRISRALHPSVIEDLGLTPAIRSLVEDFRHSEHAVTTFRPDHVPDGVPLKVATGLYRIAQEALRNVAKHAGGSHVRVLLTGGSGRIRLQVIDSGKGFRVHEARSGFGIIDMEERARTIQGVLKVESEPGEGTRVTVDVPWP